MWFAELIWKAFQVVDRLLPVDPAARAVVGFAFMWTSTSVLAYTSRRTSSRWSRTGYEINHAHGHLLQAVISGLGVTILCSILLLIMFASRSDDS